LPSCENKFIVAIHTVDVYFEKCLFADLSHLHRQQDLEVDTGGWNIHDITVVSDTRLLVTVCGMEKVMLVDSQTGGTVAQLTLQAGPFRVCMWDNNTAVVSLDRQKVQFINIKGDSLQLGPSFSVNGNVRGVGRSGDRLIVSYVSPPWLEVLATDGRVMHTFSIKAAGRDVFQSPEYIATSTDGMVYVSDAGNSTITQLDMNLRVTRTYSDPILLRPHGIISVSADQVLVCIYDNNRILLLCPSTSVITSILEQQDGIKDPWALTFSPSQRKLYAVPWDGSGRIQVFQQQ